MERFRLFADRWGQTIVFAALTLLILSRLSSAGDEGKYRMAVMRLDENYQNIWSAIRAGNPALPIAPK